MTTIREVKTWVEEQDGGFISPAMVAQKFGLTPVQAYKVMRRLWDEDFVVPVVTSFFGRPDELGIAAMDGGRRDERAKAARKAWHQADLDTINEFLDSLDYPAVTVRDVELRLDTSNQRARKLLDMLVLDSVLKARVARFGGSFGRKPTIYGRDDEALDWRERALAARESEVTRKSKSARSRKTPAVTTPAVRLPDTVNPTTEAVPYKKAKGKVKKGRMVVELDEEW